MLSSPLKYFGHGNGSFEHVRAVAAEFQRDPGRTDGVYGLCRDALDRVRSAYALLMTSVTIPMLLAGEEFADIHDTDHHDLQLKMSDPVDWYRREHAGHRDTAAAPGGRSGALGRSS